MLVASEESVVLEVHRSCLMILSYLIRGLRGMQSILANTTASPGFDSGRLADFLRTTLGGWSGDLVVRPIHGGQSNPTFLLSAGTNRYVLRTKPSGQLLPSAHAIEREYRVMSALAGTDVPVPPVLCLCEDSEVIGRAFYVMGYVEGRVLFDPALPEMTREERSALFAEMNRVIAALHGLDYHKLGLDDFGRPGHYLERQIARWSRQYRASETEHIAAMERLMEWLPARIPAGGEASIVHGDYRLDNLILDPRKPRILAVVDWELSTVGDPLVDLSYHMQIWRLTADQFRGMAGRDIGALGIPSEAQYLAAYSGRTGREEVDPRAWEFYMVFNMFRLAAILQGVLKRALDGNAADAGAIETGRRGRTLAEIAWRQVSARLL
jgi:aminoglycoside phosphotransferase (APT) family kinase protein